MKNIFTVRRNFSDYFAIKCHLPIHKPRPIKKVVDFRRLNEIDFDGFESHLYGKLDVMGSIYDVDSFVTTYNTILADIIDKDAPEEKKSISAYRKHQGYTGKSEMKRDKGDG